MLKVGRYPLWVKSGHSLTFGRCLLYRQKRTLIERVGMSALCQKQTYAAQQKNAYSITSASVPASRSEFTTCCSTPAATHRPMQATTHGESRTGSAKPLSRNSNLRVSPPPRASAKSEPTFGSENQPELTVRHFPRGLFGVAHRGAVPWRRPGGGCAAV